MSEIFLFSFEKNDQKSRNLDMISQKDYALHSQSFSIIDRNDSEIRLKHFSMKGVSKN